MASPPTFLVVAFPAQGHINPTLQFAKRLINIVKADVTFATAESAIRRMIKHNAPPVHQGLNFFGLSDGTDEGFKEGSDMNRYMEGLQHHGSEALRKLMTVSDLNKGQRFTHVFFSMLVPWVADAADSFGIKSTFLWIQPAIVFNVHYYYFNGYKNAIEDACCDPSSEIELPSLPTLNGRAIPTSLNPSSPYPVSLSLWQHHFELLKKESNPKVLVSTVDAIEAKELRAIDKLNLIAIGPLIPSAFLDQLDPSDTSFGGDLIDKHGDLISWLDMKPKASVVYVCFGSITVISKQQKEEIAWGLLESGRPFIWVIRKSMEDKDRLIYEEDLEELGMIVPWCSQLKVLSHPSIGCFISHCGWNSTCESMVCGVPLVAYPQWSDQHINAKLVEDAWKTGVRVSVNEQGVAERNEIKRCLELVLGDQEKGIELRKNAKKWGDLAIKANKESGSSYNNLKAFLEEIN